MSAPPANAEWATRYAAVVGACSYELDFTRILCVVGPFATEAEARAAGEAESEALSPQSLQDDESSIEFDVVVMKASATTAAPSDRPIGMPTGGGG